MHSLRVTDKKSLGTWVREGRGCDLLSGSRDLTEGYEILTDYQLEIIWLEANTLCLHVHVLYTSDWLGLLTSVYSDIV